MMSKLIIPATCLFLLIIAYQFHRLQTERLHAIGEIILKNWISQELDLIEKNKQDLLSGIGLDEMVHHSTQTCFVQLYAKDGTVLFQKKIFDLKGGQETRTVLSEPFVIGEQEVVLRHDLEIDSLIKPFRRNVNIFSLYSILLLIILFLFASFLIISLISKSKLEKNRIEMQNKQKEFEKQLEIVKHEKKQQEMKEEMAIKEKQLILADKMSSLGVLSSGIAHEINNPNTYIQMNAQTLQKAWKDLEPLLNDLFGKEIKIAGISIEKMSERIPDLANSIVEGSQRIEKIVADLKSFSGNNDSASIDCRFDLKSVIDGAVRLTENFVKSHCHKFIVDVGPDINVYGSPQKLEQVVINLIINACQALGSLDKKIELLVRKVNDMALITVRDEGKGINKANVERIFEPFYTTKSDNGGTGLGLAISYGIIVKMGGKIEVESEEGHYTMFNITLPLSKN